MAKSNQSGFTLVELMLVFAIMSMLSIIAIKGQSALRAKTQFDADVDKLVVSFAKVRDDTSAGLNYVGTGNGTGEACKPTDTGPTTLGGEAFVANATGFEVNYYKSNTGQDACIYDTQSISVPSGVGATVASEGQELFVRTSDGAMDVCPEALNADVDAVFAAGSCVSSAWVLHLTDGQGHTATIDVDDSGLATRLN